MVYSLDGSGGTSVSPFFIIFEPFVRLVGHSLAASFGFSGIALVAILPVEVVKLLSAYAAITPGHIALFETIESAILYLDAILLLFVIAIYSLYFVVEQWRAAWKLLRGSAAGPTPRQS